MDQALGIGILLGIVTAVVTSVIAQWSKGRSGIGWFLLGLVAPVIALFVIILMPKLEIGPTPETHVKCPDCKELVLKEASVCKHCGCRLVPTT